MAPTCVYEYVYEQMRMVHMHSVLPAVKQEKASGRVLRS